MSLVTIVSSTARSSTAVPSNTFLALLLGFFLCLPASQSQAESSAVLVPVPEYVYGPYKTNSRPADNQSHSDSNRSGNSRSDNSRSDNTSRININTANAETLDRELLGIGPGKAQAIVDWRRTHGRFLAVEQLTEVKGIGEATLEKNFGRLTID